jgi:soluble lytic murein transglycosylase-like protein
MPILLLVLSASHPMPFAAEVTAACEDVRRVWPVPQELVYAVIQRESAFRPRAVSAAGAIGLMQVMPFNAAKVGLAPEDLWEPSKNVLAGTRLLAVLLKHYDGDLISALVAYNATPRKRFAPIPQNGQTPQYVAGVLFAYRGYLSVAAAAVAPPTP